MAVLNLIGIMSLSTVKDSKQYIISVQFLIKQNLYQTRLCVDHGVSIPHMNKRTRILIPLVLKIILGFRSILSASCRG